MKQLKRGQNPISAWGGAGRGQGRKSLSPDLVTVVVSIRMTTAQRDKLADLGGSAWVRRRIDLAKGKG